MRRDAKRPSKEEVKRILTNVFLGDALPELAKHLDDGADDPIAAFKKPLIDKPMPGYQLAQPLTGNVEPS